MNEEPETDTAWLTTTVASITRRPCVVEYVPERRGSASLYGFEPGERAHWRITIKGIDHTLRVEPARIQLRDEEYLRRRVHCVLPEEERNAS